MMVVGDMALEALWLRKRWIDYVFVIDGRQTHSIGASLRDCQDILYEKVLSMRWQWTVDHQQHYMQWEIF